MKKTFVAAPLLTLLPLVLAGCVSAEPSAVARAVNATLTAVITPTPIVVVVTAVSNNNLPSVTPAPSELPVATVIAETPVPASSEVPPPTATASATATPGIPTSAPSGTPTVPATLVAPGGAVLFEDEFLRPQIWDLGQEDAYQRKTISDGQLFITLKASEKFALQYTLRRQGKNFLLLTQTALTSCNYRDRYGLLFRVQDGANYYQFDVDCDGRYRLGRVVDGTYTALHDWLAHPAVQGGRNAANELAVQVVGSTIEVYANQQRLLQEDDATFAAGGFGVYAGAGIQAPFTAAFENIRVWEVNP